MPVACREVTLYGPHIGTQTQLEHAPLVLWSARISSEDNTGQNLRKRYWNTETPSPCIPKNDSLLEKNPIAESGIEPGTYWSGARQLYIGFVPYVHFGGLGVTCSPRDSRFAGSNPAEVDGFFQDLKILSRSPPGGALSWGSRFWDFRLVKEPQAWKNRPLSKL